MNDQADPVLIDCLLIIQQLLYLDTSRHTSHVHFLNLSPDITLSLDTVSWTYCGFGGFPRPLVLAHGGAPNFCGSCSLWRHPLSFETRQPLPASTWFVAPC